MEYQAPDIDLELIAKLDRNGPRYTSYPTADRFTNAYTSADYSRHAAQRNAFGLARPLSLYVHLPFCSSLCYYCACNKIVTQDARKAERYFGYLEREIALQGELFGDDAAVTQMHWGGGTPTYYAIDDLARLFKTLRRHFDFDPFGEYSIEIDPRTVDPGSMDALRTIGFNRASFGIQDFDTAVQRAINREQSEEQTTAVMEAARRAGFGSLNVDLIYGLPQQNLESFAQTLERVVTLKPDRIAVYNYAHLPSRFRAQSLIAAEALPTPATKLQLFGLAARCLIAAGYVYIGMDHFALPEDALALAQRHGRLQRNFQGYSTHAQCDLVGLGVSAIGAVGPTYSQNARTLSDYYARLDRNELPIIRGAILTPDDLVRRSVIQTLMCHFELSKRAVEIAYLIDFDRYFAAELAELADLEHAGLLSVDPEWISVSAKGRMLIRSICMVFDKYLRRDRETARYSRTI